MVRSANLPAFIAASLAAASASADVVRFDITEANLAIFGVQYTADFLGPHDGFVTEVRAHLVFNSGSFNAENLLIQFEAPVGPSAPYPLWELSGSTLNWSGTGAFTADLSTTALNGRILDGQGQPGSFSLWFLRIVHSGGTFPIGGQFTGSYFEVEYTPIPAPASSALLPVSALLLGRRRRR